MKHRAAPVLLAGVLFFPSCAPTVVRNGAIHPALSERIEVGTAAIRGLPFRTPVPKLVKTPDELRAHLERELERQYSAEELAHLQRVYVSLGLLPPETDLAEALLRLYTAQIAGFYDPHVGKLFLVDPAPSSGSWLLRLLEMVLRRDLVGEMVLAHELTHALQDQHFTVLALAEDTEDEDRALAVAAAVEGDATLSGFAYVFGGLPETSLLDLVDRLQAIPGEVAASLPQTPAILREGLIFRYTEGARFASWAYLQGGWRAVDAMLAAPPRSTEQVLWPEKYYADVDDPVTVRLGGLDSYRDDEWTQVEENTLGELGVRVLFQEHLPAAAAIDAARGWDGDRFAAYERQGSLHLFWMTIWDSEDDAREFFAAETEVLAQIGSQEPHRSADRVEASGDRPYCLEQHGPQALLILGIPPDECREVGEKVWAATTIVPVAVPLSVDVARALQTRE